MSTVPVVPQENEMYRKVGDEWVASYQPKDEWGNQVGPLQIFKGKTLKECAEKVGAAHQNATVALHRTKKAVKIGGLLELDEEAPMPNYKPRTLTAEEVLELDEKFNNPTTRAEAMRTMLEAEIGAPIEVVRRNLQKTDVAERMQFIRAEVKKFTDAHPEYVPSQANSDLLEAWLEKRNKPVTHKNLEIAFADLCEDGLLTLRAVSDNNPKVATEPAPVPTPAPVATAPVTVKPVAPAPAAEVEEEEVVPVVTPSPAPEPEVESEEVAVPVKTLAEINDMTSEEFRAFTDAGGVVPQPDAPIVPPVTQPAAHTAPPVVATRPSSSSSGLSSRGSSVGQAPRKASSVGGITWDYVNSLSSTEYDRKLNTDKVFAAAVAKLIEAGKK